jgi:hypothetical protein
MLRLAQHIVRALHERGVAVGCGSDAGRADFVPRGTSLHDELAFLVEAGLPPREALRAAFVADAVPGRVAALRASERADMVVLDANVRRIHGIVVAGRWIGPEELARRREELAEAYAGWDPFEPLPEGAAERARYDLVVDGRLLGQERLLTMPDADVCERVCPGPMAVRLLVRLSADGKHVTITETGPSGPPATKEATPDGAVRWRTVYGVETRERLPSPGMIRTGTVLDWERCCGAFSGARPPAELRVWEFGPTDDDGLTPWRITVASDLTRGEGEISRTLVLRIERYEERAECVIDLAGERPVRIVERWDGGPRIEWNLVPPRPAR